jgi:hypothetical protein
VDSSKSHETYGNLLLCDNDAPIRASDRNRGQSGRLDSLERIFCSISIVLVVIYEMEPVKSCERDPKSSTRGADEAFRQPELCWAYDRCQLGMGYSEQCITNLG